MKKAALNMKSLFALTGLLFTFSICAADRLIEKTEQQYNLGLGRVVFTEQCIKCHGEPESGAPQLGEVTDWEERLKSPLGTLITHALEGHGKMPPKGGLDQLSDRDVSAAVAYVVDRGRLLFVEKDGQKVLLFDKICHEQKQLDSCKQSRIDNTLLLQMFWLITGQKRE